MKKLCLHKFLLLAGITMSMLFSACSSDPATPTDEKENKLHEDPARAVFTLVEGRLRDGADFSKMPREADFVASDNKQQIVWQVVTGSSFSISSEGVRQFRVNSMLTHPDVVYSLKIDYYNAAGQLMNNQFFDNEQDRVHQHFFQYFVNNERVKKREDLPFDYTYADSYNGTFIGQSNPMGFYGFLRFTADNLAFPLTVSLMHAGNVTKFDDNGRVSPFYRPSAKQTGTALWDIIVRLPVVIGNAE